MPVDAGSVSPQEASTDPSGEKASHSAAPAVSRQGGPGASRVRVPEDDAAGRVARCQGAAVGGQVDATDRRVVVAEQRDLAAAEPPEVPPGEVAMPGAWSVDVVEEDLLGPLELPDVARLAGQPQLGGVEVPVGHRLGVLASRPCRSDSPAWRSAVRSHVEPLVVVASQAFDQAIPPAAPTATITARAARAACAGRRRAHFRPRSQSDAGRAWIGCPARNRSRSSASAAAEG